MPTLLLHLCCGNCGLVPLKKLVNEFSVALFWSNPNIWPIEEYQKRLLWSEELSKIYNVPLIVDNYEVDKWLLAIKGLENEPEGGKRCKVCFRFRLEETVKMAKKKKFDYFATTLSASLYKNIELINKIGNELEKKYGIKYYSFGLDPRQTYQEELILSKEHGFYRQKYCGCQYSQKPTVAFKNK